MSIQRLLLFCVLVGFVHGDSSATPSPSRSPSSSSSSSSSSSPSPSLPPPRLFSGFSSAQPFYVASGTIGTSYPDVGMILMSWNYAQDVIVHNRPVYALATQLAIKHVHESGILGTRMIRMELLDDAGSSQQAQRNLLTGLISNANTTALPLLGVFGSQSHVSSLGMLEIASTLDLVGISAAPSFDWIKTKYLYQTVAVTNVQLSRVVDATFALTVSQGWRRLGCLGPQDDNFNTFLAYATTQYAAIQQFYAVIAAAYIVQSHAAPDGYMSLLPAFIANLKSLLKNNVTVFMIATFDEQYQNVIYTALTQLNILDNPNNMVLCIGGWCVSDGSLPPGTVGSNILSIRGLPADADRYDTLVHDIMNRTTLSGFNTTEQTLIEQTLMYPSTMSVVPYYYDMGYILTSAIATVYQSGIPFTSENVYQTICNTTWNSPLTGRVQFDRNGMVAAPVVIYQRIPTQNQQAATQVSNSWTVIGVYRVVNPTLIIPVMDDNETYQDFEWKRSIVYATPDGKPLLDHTVPPVARLWHTSNALNDGIYGWTGAVTGVILSLALFLWRKRNTLLIQCTQLGWSLILLLSLVSLSISTVFYVLPPAEHSWVCHVRPWCTSTSLVCVLVTLLTKINRIRYIYNNPHINSTRQKQFKDTWIFSTLLLPQLILLIAFSAANLSQPTTFTSSSIGDNTYALLCTDLETKGWLVWFIFELIYVFFLLLLLLYMAFTIRHTPSAFNESVHLLLCVFTLCVMLAILVPLQFIVNSQPSAVLLCRGIGQPLTALIVTITLFGPKIRYICMGRGNDSSLAEKAISFKGVPESQHELDHRMSELHSIATEKDNYIRQWNQDTTVRCGQLEQQMTLIRALLLKYASNEGMNDEGLNFMSSISHLTGNAPVSTSMHLVHLAHSNSTGVSFSDSANPSTTTLLPHHRCTNACTDKVSSIGDVCPHIVSETRTSNISAHHDTDTRLPTSHHPYTSSSSATPVTVSRYGKRPSPPGHPMTRALEIVPTIAAASTAALSHKGTASTNTASQAQSTQDVDSNAPILMSAPIVESVPQAASTAVIDDVVSSRSHSHSELNVNFWG